VFLSNVVQFDIPLLPDPAGLDIIHLQCHIGTDTLSLARRGAKSVVGLDFSPASIKEGQHLAANAAGGEKLRFVEASTYDALEVLTPGSFDLVFTGVGAICWLPNIRQWASVVSGLLKPGGKFFIREAHPMLWTLDEKIEDRLAIRYPFFETEQPMMFQDDSTYMKLADDWKTFENATTLEWNHGIGEIVQALLDEGMEITGLKEHRSIPWDALPRQMVELGNGEWSSVCSITTSAELMMFLRRICFEGGTGTNTAVLHFAGCQEEMRHVLHPGSSCNNSFTSRSIANCLSFVCESRPRRGLRC